MKPFIKHVALMAVVLAFFLGSALAYAQCPEDPSDRGECDTLNVVCLDGEQTPGTGPWSIRFPLLVTHDQTETSDSIAGFAIPLVYTHTNPAAYCSVTSYWNGTLYYSIVPDFARSIFRHMFETDYPTPSADTLYRNRMAAVEGMFTTKGWDLVILEFGDGTDYFWLTMVPTGSADQRWWEGDRTLLATMTMRVQDTTDVCIDSTFWPPATPLTFARSDAETYIPRHNLPQCFRVGPPLPPDFAIEATPDTQVVVAGDSADYDVILTSLNGFSSSVDLSVSGLPTDATSSFDPDPVVPTATSVMRVRTGATTPAGTYDLTITGTEVVAKVEHTTQVVLKVTIPETIALTAPNGSEEWCAGSGHNITWTSGGMDSVKIEYSTNGGSGWITVVDQYQAAAGSYPWTVPGTPSDNCLVKICDAKDGDPCDQSEAAFTINDIPAAPTGCIASDDLCDSVEVSWTDNSNNELKFYIYRDAALLDSVGAGVTIYRDATGTPGTTYEYCVSAYNGCGQSAQTCDDGTRKPVPDAPSDCVATDDQCDKVQVTWTDNSDDELGFVVSRGGSVLDSVGSGVELYDDPTATPGTTYEYCVAAYNECGQSGQSCDNGTRKAPPDAPSDCAATDDLCDKIQFTWTDNSDNEAGFYIYRDGAEFDTLAANIETYDDPTASAGATYRYCVAAYNECGVSDSCCAQGFRPTPPVAPSDCAATDDLCDKVQLTWTDNSDNEAGFYIYRDGAEFDTLAANVQTYNDLTAAPGATYRYCVSAYNSCGESDSCCEDGTRQAPPDSPTDCAATDDLCDKVQVTWTDNSDDEAGFYIYRDATKIDSLAADAESYDDLTGTPGTTYDYCVSAYKACGESGQSCDNGTRKATPTAPSDCVASDDLCDGVHFCWTDNSGDELKFYIYRDATLLDSVGTDVTCYDDPSAAPGVTYEYCVTAFNQCGESGPCCDDGMVEPEAVTVTDPNGGESWTVGSSHNITWTSDCLDNVKIEYSTNNGSNWTEEVASTPAGPGTYSWTIPDEPSDQCLVRVSDADDGTPSDVSDQVFSILTGDFSLDVFPDTLFIMRTTPGDSFTVELTSMAGFSSACTLTVSGLPTDAAGVFHPATVVPTGSAQLVITAAGTTPEGYFTLTVTATEIVGAKALEHSEDVVIRVVLPTWGFELEADPDSLNVAVGTPANCVITMLPDVGFTAPCTLSVDGGLPTGATAEFSDTIVYPYDPSILTIATDGTTPAGRYDISVRGVANFKQQQWVDVTVVVLVVKDFSFAALEDSIHVTQGQAVGFQLEFESLFGFSDPCTMMVSGLPAVDSAVFDPPKLIPSGGVLLTVYTSLSTPAGRHVFTVTAQSQPGGKPVPVVEHSMDLILMVEEYSDVDDWTDDFNRPQGFALFQNQPNPFNPETRISYFLPEASRVSLNIYNVLGQRVRTLLEDYQEAGTHTLTWDGRTDDGAQLSSGIYFYRMQAGSFQETKKMTLMK